MPRKLITKAEWSRLHGWSRCNTSRLLKAGTITDRPDGLLDFHQVETQLSEHRQRPSMFRDVHQAKMSELRIKRFGLLTLRTEHLIRHKLNLCLPRKEHLQHLERLRDRLKHEMKNACWDIALKHCPPDGNPNAICHDLRQAVEETFQAVDPADFEAEGPPEWSQNFIREHGLEM